MPRAAEFEELREHHADGLLHVLVGIVLDPARARRVADASATCLTIHCKSDYGGVRPKIARPGGSAADFLVQTVEDHGVPGLINLFGIESPGLTASLAIAKWITRLI